MRVIHKPANPLSGFQTGEFTGFLHRCSHLIGQRSAKTLAQGQNYAAGRFLELVHSAEK